MDSGHENNGHAERIGNLILGRGWPKTKEDATKLKSEVEAAQKAADQARRLSEIRKLGSALRYTTKLETVRAIVEKLKELCE